MRKEIQFIGTTPEELKKELFTFLSVHFEEIKRELLPKTSEEYLTRQEVSKLLGVSLVTLNSWDRKGVLKPYRIGSQVRYKKSQIEESLQEIRR